MKTFTKHRFEYIEPADLEFVPVDPNPNFDPEKNRKVIKETIRKNEVNMRRRLRENDEAIKERASAIAFYLKNIERGQGNTNVTKYFGRRYMAKLRGDEILAKLKDKFKGGEIMRRVE